MSLDCCDPTRLPTTDPLKTGDVSIVTANHLQFAAGEYKEINPPHGVLLASTAGADFIAQPGKLHAFGTADNEVYNSRGGRLILHARGPWTIYSATAQTIVVKDCSDVLAAMSSGAHAVQIFDGASGAIVRLESNLAADDTGFTSTEYGLVVNSRAAFYDTVGTDWTMWRGAALTSIHGASQTAVVPRVAAHLFGRTSSDATTRLLESVGPMGLAVASGLYGLYTAAAVAAYVSGNSLVEAVAGLRDVGSVAGEAGLGTFN